MKFCAIAQSEVKFAEKHLRSKLHYTVTSLPQATSLAQRANLVEKDSDCITIRVFFWQGHKDLNPEPTVLETAALPIELYPYILTAKAEFLWWAFRDSNPGLSGYAPEALTN